MKGHTHLQGYAQSAVSRQIHTAPAQVVLRSGAHVDVVSVVVVILHPIGIHREAIPESRVSGGLQKTWHSAAERVVHRVVRAYNVAHTASEAYGIGGHHSARTALVGEQNAVVVQVARAEAESAQIYPCAATHLLVDGEGSVHTLMAHHIMSVIDAVGQSLIGNIHRIVAFFGDDRPPYHCAERLSARHAFRHAARAIGEGVVSILVISTQIGKSCAGISPLVSAVHFLVKAVGVRCVVIHYHLILLPVALAGGEDARSCVLQHGHEIRHHDGLCEKVFCCAEQTGTLPHPFLCIVAEILAVTGPQTEMPALQSACDGVGERFPLHPWVTFVVQLAIHPGRVLLLCQVHRHKHIDGGAVGIDYHIIALQVLGQTLLYVLLDALHRFGCERLPQKTNVQVDIHLTLFCVYCDILHCHTVVARVAGGIAVVVLQIVGKCCAQSL